MKTHFRKEDSKYGIEGICGTAWLKEEQVTNEREKITCVGCVKVIAARENSLEYKYEKLKEENAELKKQVQRLLSNTRRPL